MGDRLQAALAVLKSDALIEHLAAIEHERWSHWQRHLHQQCTQREDGSLIIPAQLAQRWASQFSTSYDQLSEEEKASDRDQVMRYLPEIEATIRGLTDSTSKTPVANDASK